MSDLMQTPRRRGAAEHGLHGSRHCGVCSFSGSAVVPAQ